MDEPHRHTDVELNYVLEGAIAYVIGGRRGRVERGGAAVFWAGMPHRLVEVEGEAEFVYVTVPLAWFLQLGVDPAFVTRLLEGELVRAAADDELAGATDRLFFERWVAELATGDPEARRTVLLELEARLRRFAAGVVPVPARTHPRAETEAGAGQVERIARFLGESYRRPLTVAEVGRAVGLNPTYAMTLFKRGVGIGVWDYVIRLRVSHAQRLLLTTDLPLEQIAADSGFGSAASFYRAFRRICGCTPRQYRVR